jgi:putative hydrolase of the HAD superfamily
MFQGVWMATTTVIFDLFGTLVAAPSTRDRAAAAAALAYAATTPQAAVESYLQTSWLVRHDGAISSTTALAAHVLAAVGSRRPTEPVVITLKRLAVHRIKPDPSVTDMLERLRDASIRVGVISDASAEVAEAWHASPLAPHVDHAVFSCTAGAVKPAASLYKEVLHILSAVPGEILYIGDGGGDELRGAETLGIRAVCVRRRGGEHALAYNVRHDWQGARIDSVDNIQPSDIETLGQNRSAW